MPLDLNVFDEDRFMGVDELAKNDLLVTLTLNLSLGPNPDLKPNSNPYPDLNPNPRGGQ